MAATRTRRAGVAAISLLAAVALGLSGCTGGGPAGGSDDANTIDAGVAGSIDDAIASAMQLSGSDAAIVGVWTGSGEYVHAYGEGLEASAPIRAAQASQPVMCALLLDLVEEGKLKLDRKVSKDLPRQVGLDDITYGQLCEATSGLADFKSKALTDISRTTRPGRGPIANCSRRRSPTRRSRRRAPSSTSPTPARCCSREPCARSPAPRSTSC